MKYILLFFVILCPLVAFSSDILDKLNANNDHGLWLDQNVDINLSEHWTLLNQMEERWGSDYRQIWYFSGLSILQYDIKDNLCLGPNSSIQKIALGPGFGATRLLKKDTTGDWHWVWYYRYLLEANIDIQYHRWIISQRLRGSYIEYTKKHYKNYGSFRYRLTLNSPWKWTCFNINPYCSNEWFFRNNTYHKTHPNGLVGGWEQNRLRVGFNVDLFDNLAGALFWQWRATKQKPGTHPRWNNNYTLGISLTMELDYF